MSKEKVVLAYSGGLDTTAIIPWLKENYDYEVIAVCGDVGQGKETEGLEERAKKAGASKLYIEDLRDEYIRDFIYPTLKAGAVYEGKYLLGTSHARPCIAKRIVEKASEYGIHKKDIIVDPGFGFGKTLEHNYEMMAHLEEFHLLEHPLLVGVSRKSMVYRLLDVSPDDALNGTTALHAVALLKGVHILRVHDVAAAHQAIKICTLTSKH